MRTIDTLRSFRRDYRREIRGRYSRILDDELQRVIHLLASDEPLPSRYHDHPLVGSWTGSRDCHIRFDLVLIYRKVGDDVLELARLGSHNELGL